MNLRNLLLAWSTQSKLQTLRNKYETHSVYELELLEIELQIRDDKISVPTDLANKFFAVLVPLTAVLLSVQAGLTTLFTAAVQHSTVSSSTAETTISQMAKVMEHSALDLWNLTWKTLIGIAFVFAGLSVLRIRNRRHLLVVQKVLHDKQGSTARVEEIHTDDAHSEPRAYPSGLVQEQ